MFRTLFRVLYVFWFLFLLPVGYIFIIAGGLGGWDHRFGHPPYAIWVMGAVYLIVGGLLKLAAGRPESSRTLVSGASHD